MKKKIFNTEVTIPPGHLCCFTNDNNDYIFASPGVHNIQSPFFKQIGGPRMVRGNGNVIVHGNRTVVTVPQGMLGYASDMGQPVLLPPGLHSWTSETMVYERLLSLDSHVIKIGPYTILTVDEGYSAITQNNGLQVVLGGGKTHLLTHQKWRFEKFITQKIQTDDLEKIQAASADNVIMSVNSTVVWKIKDVRIAATMAAETMARSGEEVSANISKLRNDVLKQAIASLASFIGSVNYSDSFHVAAAAQRNMENAVVVGEVVDGDNNYVKSNENPMFDNDRMSDSVSHANQITSKYGVEILSINIISANPIDEHLTASLATGAVASAEALQAETQARGIAKARRIEADSTAVTRMVDAESEAKSQKILAESASVTQKIYAESKAEALLIEAKSIAQADVLKAEGQEALVVEAKSIGKAEVLKAEGLKQAEILRAQGSKQAAELIQSSQVAVELEKMKSSANAIKSSDKFFFGQEPEYMSNMLMKAPFS